MPPLLGIIGTVASVAGTVASIAGAQRQAQLAAQQANYQNQLDRQQAAEKVAEATRQAADDNLKTKTLQSNQLAVAAASGAGVTTPTVAQIAADTAGRGEFLQQGDLYTGMQQAQNLQQSGAAGLVGAGGHGNTSDTWGGANWWS